MVKVVAQAFKHTMIDFLSKNRNKVKYKFNKTFARPRNRQNSHGPTLTDEEILEIRQRLNIDPKVRKSTNGFTTGM